MARTKTQSDADLVAHLLAILAEHGEKGLTFGVLSQRCGLAPATLAQRFGSVEAMVRRAILSEWDRLSLAVSELEAEAHISSKGAQALLKSIPPPSPHVLALSLRDPDLRTAAEAWRGQVEAALAARRAGAGLVTIATPREAMATYQAAEPGNLIAEVEDGEGFARLLDDDRRNAILIGPGSGLNERTRASVAAALATGRPVVLDADAITVLAGNPGSLFGSIRGPVLLTPHEGEFRRLFPALTAVPGKVDRTRHAAQQSGATVLLKGPDTVIAAPDGRAVVNVHAPATLATAGSGDVLAGMAAGLMTRGLSPLAAGAAAAWLHGDCAFRFARPGLIAEDLIDRIPEALAALIPDHRNGHR